MYDHHDSEKRYIDELADYTDRLLSEEPTEEQSEPSSDPELTGLKDTLKMMKRVIGPGKPSKELHDQVLANLAREYRAAGFSERKQTLWQRLFSWFSPQQNGWQSSGSRQRGYVLRYAAVMAIVLLAACFIFPAIGDTLPGAALTPTALVPVFLVFGLVIAIFYYWFIRRKR